MQTQYGDHRIVENSVREENIYRVSLGIVRMINPTGIVGSMMSALIVQYVRPFTLYLGIYSVVEILSLLCL